jgi:hypothetical protein
MRGLAVASLVLALGACSVIPGGLEPDPLAGWGGTWTGTYQASSGNTGALEFEINTDTTGAPMGAASFNPASSNGRARMETPILTADSLNTSFRFQGMVAEIAGVRTEDQAEGIYRLHSEDTQQVFDSGTWRVTRRARGVTGR